MPACTDALTLLLVLRCATHHVDQHPLYSVPQAVPACTDALTLLAGLQAALPGRVASTVAHFKDAAAKKPDDVVIAEALGELLAPTDPQGALRPAPASCR